MDHVQVKGEVLATTFRDTDVDLLIGCQKGINTYCFSNNTLTLHRQVLECDIIICKRQFTILPVNEFS